jgi:acetate kinase
LEHATSVAYFDTAFHRGIPQHISAYAIDQDVAKRKGLKKYGFHGLSCVFNNRGPIRPAHELVDSYILRTAARHLSKVYRL